MSGVHVVERERASLGRLIEKRGGRDISQQEYGGAPVWLKLRNEIHEKYSARMMRMKDSGFFHYLVLARAG